MEWRSKLSASAKASPFSCHQNLITIVMAAKPQERKERKGSKIMVKRERKAVKTSVIFATMVAVTGAIIWGSVATAQRNGSASMYAGTAGTYIVEGKASETRTVTVVPVVTPIEPVITPVAPAAVSVEPVEITAEVMSAPAEEAAKSVESTEITAEGTEDVGSETESETEAEITPAMPSVVSVESMEIEEPATFAEPVATPAPVAVSAEPMAAPAEPVVVPTKTAVVSVETVETATATVAPVVATVEPVATSSSFVEFYDEKLNRLYVNLSDFDFVAVQGILESYGNVDLYDYESQERIEM